MIRKLCCVFAVALAAACSSSTNPTSTSGGMCATATCPTGCNGAENPDGGGCVCAPSSPNVSSGSACLADADCCTGSCVNGACSAVVVPGTTTGTSGSASSSSGGRTTTGSGAGSTTGSNSSACPIPAGAPNLTALTCTADADCKDPGATTPDTNYYCTAKKVCKPKCTYLACECFGTYVCNAGSGHCEPPASSTGGSSTTAASSSSTGHSTSSASTSTSASASTTGGVASSSASTGGSTGSHSTSTGGSSGSTTGAASTGGTGGACTCSAACCSVQSSPTSLKGSGLTCQAQTTPGDCYGGYWCQEIPAGGGACSKLDPCNGAGGVYTCGGSSTTGGATTTTGGVTTTGGAGSTGTSTGGTGTGGLGGCTADQYSQAEFTTCGSASATCTCGTACVVDPSTIVADYTGSSPGGSYCETPCVTTADCLDPATACVGKSCTINNCTGAPYATCPVNAAADGYCYPVDYLSSGVEDDLCVLSGTSAVAGSCSVSALANQASQLCVAGALCGLSPADAGICVETCDPSGNYPGAPTCATAQVCTAPPRSTIVDQGYCQ